MARFRGNNLQRHQKPYEKVGKLTDRPPGADPYRGPGDMSELDMDTGGPRREQHDTNSAAILEFAYGGSG